MHISLHSEKKNNTFFFKCYILGTISAIFLLDAGEKANILTFCN